jgi:uncharacterized repeat protein (TIGR01451 family)
VPEGFGSVAATGDGWVCTVDVRTVACVRAEALAVGVTAPPIAVTATPLPGFEGTRTNTATVEGTIFEPDSSSNSASDQVDVVAVIDLVTTKTLVSTTASPRTALWRVEVTNRGPSPATGVTVTDVLPSGLTFLSANGAGWTCAVAGQQVTCVLTDPLASGATAAVEILTGVEGAEGTSLTNTASARGDGVDLDESNNTDGAETRVLAAIAVNPSSPVTTGSPVGAPAATTGDLASDTASDSSGDLASTGTHADRQVEVGMLLLGAGSLLVIGTRRRRIRARRRR